MEDDRTLDEIYESICEKIRIEYVERGEKISDEEVKKAADNLLDCVIRLLKLRWVKMSDQPRAIYKYFGKEAYQNAFLNEGEVYFNSLSFFLSCEDTVRKDTTEHANIFSPSGGLQITNVNTQQTFTDQRSLIAKIKRPERVFIFSASTELNDTLCKKFSANSCIKIFDLKEFHQRLTKALRARVRLGTVKNTNLLSGEVDYYELENEQGTRYACPDQIIMSKPTAFMEEKEYRFAFARDKNAFDVYNLNYSISPHITPYEGRNTHQILTLGNLKDICKIVS